MRQIAAQKVHSRSTIQKNLKRVDVRLRAPSHGHGNPAQLRFGFKKKEGIVSYHKGEQLIIEVIMDFRDDGLTFRQIAKRMTALKIPSKNGKKKWHPMMVKRIIDTYKSSKEGKYEEKTHYNEAWMTVIDKKTKKETTYYHRNRLYSKNEIVLMLKQVGFKKISVVGDHHGNKFSDKGSTHPFFFAQK